MTDMPESVIATILQRARSGVTTGRVQHPVEVAYVRRCSHFHWQSGTVIMFTRDTGHHSGGWFKSPDYERCRHLSLSFRVPYPGRDPTELGLVHNLGVLMRATGSYVPLRPFDAASAAAWVKLILGEDRRFAWEEGPFTPEGKELGVRHYRVFCDRNWEPILPRGEVYSRELTEKGWKSFSDVGASQPSHVSAE